MAQWRGQFSGHTHATRVEDAEDALRHAVAVFLAADPTKDRRREARSVRNLAGRLLAARLKLLRARLAALEPVAEGREQNADGIEALKERETRTRAEGERHPDRVRGAERSSVRPAKPVRDSRAGGANHI